MTKELENLVEALTNTVEELKLLLAKAELSAEPPPKRNYKKELQDLGFEIIGSVTFNDGKYSVKGNIKLVKKYTKLPVQFDTVTGDFICWQNDLESLEGAPIEVGGDFICFMNKLKSLQGGPIEVGGDFWCQVNELTNLIGGPKIVGGDFNCFKNKLKSLEGGPETVGGYFDCSSNDLVSIKGGPKTVGGDFKCSWNNLTSLEGGPKTVGRDFSCRGNPNLKSLDGIGKVKGIIVNDL